jgi:dCMP deaminase
MRKTKDDFYFDVAKSISTRSTCLCANVGAILVKDDMIISQGYNGSYRGSVNCCDTGICKKPVSAFEVGASSNYEYCEAVHAEMNAIINAARFNGNVIDSVMYVYYNRIDGRNTHAHICKMCHAASKNAGIKEIKIHEEQK